MPFHLNKPKSLSITSSIHCVPSRIFKTIEVGTRLWYCSHWSSIIHFGGWELSKALRAWDAWLPELTRGQDRHSHCFFFFTCEQWCFMKLRDTQDYMTCNVYPWVWTEGLWFHTLILQLLCSFQHKFIIINKE